MVAAPIVTSVFEFEEEGVTYSCCLESPSGNKDQDAWWWFSVSSAADRQRYAPFRAQPGDTPHKVRPRIIAWYADMLVKRATPSIPAYRRGRPPAAVAAAKAEAAAEAEV